MSRLSLRPLVAVFAAITTTCAALMAFEAGYRLNVSESLPPGIWRVERLDAPMARGQVYLVCVPPSPILREARRAGYVRAGMCPGGMAPLLKPLAGLPGDHVAITPAGARVNGVLIPNTAPLAVDGEGRPIPAVPHASGIVRPGEAWLLSDYNPASFDSRYLGAVPLSSLRQVARPVLTTSRISHD